MANKLSDLFVKLGLNSSSFNKGIDGAQKKTNAFGKGIAKIGGLIAGAFAIGQIVSFGKELVEIGGIAEGVRSAFNRMADDKVLDNLKKATKGTVSELELMKRAVSAKNLGLPIEKLASLFEFATKRAQETGESVDFLVNSIVTGIGRKSPLILDNLGISAIELREQLKGVGFESAQVSDIAAAVGRIAAKSMEESGGIIDTTAIKMQNLVAEWQNWKEAIASSDNFLKLVKGSLDDLMAIGTIFTSDQVSAWGKIKALLFSSREEYIKLADSIDAAREKEKELAEQIDEDSTEYRNRIEAERTLREEQANRIQTVGELKKETDKLKESLESLGVNQDAELQKTLAQIKANEDLIKSLTTLRSVREETPATIATRGETPQIGLDFVPETGLANMQSFFDRMDEQLKDFTADYLADWKELGESLDMLIVDGIVGIADQFGQAIESIFAGEFDIKSLGANLLKNIGDFLGEFGKMLILYGIAQEAFWTSLGLGPIGAGVAIAAGVALIAIGGAISGVGQKVSKGNLSTGGGGGGASGGGFNPGGGTRAEDNRVVFELEGTKLIGVMQNTSRRRGIIA